MYMNRVKKVLLAVLTVVIAFSVSLFFGCSAALAESENLGSTRVYDSLDEMVSDLTLMEGQAVQTLGYRRPQDLGGAAYRICASQSESYCVSLKNGLFAEMIYGAYLTPEMFGAIGDGISDDLTSLQAALSTGRDVRFQNDYAVSDTLELDTAATVDGCGRTLFAIDRFAGDCVVHICGNAAMTGMTFVRNIQVDCNAKQIDGILLEKKRVALENCVVRFCGANAYRLVKCGDSHILNCSATNVGRKYEGREFEKSIALKNESNDVYVDTFGYIDYHIGVEHRGDIGFYNNIHGFVLRYLDYIWPGSVMIKVRPNKNCAVTILNSYADSQQYGYLIQGHGVVNIIGGTAYVNTAVWNDTNRSKNNTYIIRHNGGDIVANFLGMTICGANGEGNEILFAYEDAARYINIDDCNFRNVIDNVTRAQLSVPHVRGREYAEHSISRIDKSSYSVALQFTFSPSVQGAIAPESETSSDASLHYAAGFPERFLYGGGTESGLDFQTLSACYYENGSKAVYPLLAYRRGSGIYFSPYPGDSIITDDRNTASYTVQISGIVTS